MRRVSFLGSTFTLAIGLIAVWALIGGVERVSATHMEPGGCPLPHATVKVWDTEPFLGFNPDESVEDPIGLTGHGTGAPTIVTVYENTTHPCGPCGVSYWNPDTNVFVDYGKTGGFQTGVDLNRAGPVEPGGPFGTSFGPGDTWMSGQMSDPLYMQIAGTNFFRTYHVDLTWGVEVDEGTGDVFFTEPSPGNIARVDPTTNLVTRWTVGGNPVYVTLDTGGRPYATLSSTNQIARVNAGGDGILGTGDDTATYWAVPTPGAFVVQPGFFETPDGITIDASGRIWFSESAADKIGRLDVSADVICEYAKPGLDNPQLIASTGVGGTLQTYFTEGLGNSVSVVTEVEADHPANPDRVCTASPPATMPVPPSSFTPPISDNECLPRTFVIPPMTFDVPGLDGFESGATKTSGPDGVAGTADDECIPAILRFSPMPEITPVGSPFPSGMTGVYAPNRIAGAYLISNEHFEVRSAAIIAPPPGNKPPDCSAATASPAELWPPNHKLVNVTVTGVTDTDGDAVVIAVIGVRQDEPLNGLGDGDTCPDAVIGAGSVRLRAERSGTPKVPRDGRVYHVSFVADDGKGGKCEGVVKVCVPHDQRPGHVCVNQGPLYDSTKCP